MLISPISSINSINFKSAEVKSVKEALNQEDMTSEGLSIEASDALKAQVLYQNDKKEEELQNLFDESTMGYVALEQQMMEQQMLQQQMMATSNCMGF